MKIVQNNLGIMNLFLVVFFCGLPSFAVESPTPVQSVQSLPAQRLIMQIESQPHMTSFDCSHLVHELYDRVGLHYQYANSRALYRGIEEFQRVLNPSYGDLIVWPGHAGIVVEPSQHRFMSALKTGVKTSSYISRYWKRLGPPRFFRFAFSPEKPKELDRTDKSIPVPASSATLGNN
jgi:hypothetical protein